MSTIINGFYISYRMCDAHSEVRKIGYIDEFNRLCDMELVFLGTWEECVEFARKGGAYE